MDKPSRSVQKLVYVKSERISFENNSGKLSSEVWKHFVRVKVDNIYSEFMKCIKCYHVLLNSAGLGRKLKLRELDGSGTDHCGTGTGMGMTAVGTGLHCYIKVTNISSRELHSDTLTSYPHPSQCLLSPGPPHPHNIPDLVPTSPLQQSYQFPYNRHWSSSPSLSTATILVQ